MMQSGEWTKMPGCGTRLSRSRTNYKKIASSVPRNRNHISRNTCKVERDKGIEPSPRPWQGRVLPLYESRVRKTSRQAFIYSMAYGAGQDLARVGVPDVALPCACGVLRVACNAYAAGIGFAIKLRGSTEYGPLGSGEDSGSPLGVPHGVFAQKSIHQLRAGRWRCGLRNCRRPGNARLQQLVLRTGLPRGRGLLRRNPQSHFRLRGDGNRNFAAIVAVRSDHA